MLLFVISGFCLLFGWMLFLAESLSSLRQYFFLVGIHCSVYIINSLLAANSMCSWEPHLLDCKPWLIKVFHQFMRLTIRAAYIFYFFTLSKGIDDHRRIQGGVNGLKPPLNFFSYVFWSMFPDTETFIVVIFLYSS